MSSSLMGRSVGILMVLGLLVAGCGGQDSAVSDTTAGGEPAATGAPADQKPAAVEGAATLAEHSGSGVSGEATLRWDPDSEVMSVTVEADGLEDGATYRAVIASGCQRPTTRIHFLGTVTRGPDGTGRVTVEVTDVETVELDGGWVVLLARPQVGPQACGDVVSR